MMTPRQLADAIGRKRIADAVGVGLTAVSNAVVREAFPSSWSFVLRSLAKEAGQPCPDHLFRRRIANSPNVDKSAKRQAAPRKKKRVNA